jgi:hypothetical protein
VGEVSSDFCVLLGRERFLGLLQSVTDVLTTPLLLLTNHQSPLTAPGVVGVPGRLPGYPAATTGFVSAPIFSTEIETESPGRK